MSKQARILTVIILLGIGSVLVVMYRNAMRKSAYVDCISHLKQIDSAKAHWELEYNKTSEDIPTWEDLKGHIKVPPTCEKGGEYSIGKLKDIPRCSILEHEQRWGKITQSN